MPRVEWSEFDKTCMQRAIEIAEKGRGQVAPNPPVGCILVKDNKIIAEGWHDHLGGLHAEQMAIHDAERRGISLNGAIAYVTLEPCNHYGRTPPCTEALMWAGIKRVNVAHHDPNPTVRGNGFSTLKDAGIETYQGLMKEEAALQMQSFLNWCHRRIPLITLKIAIDQQGAVDDRTIDSQRFTSKESLDAVHRLRRSVDAVLIGVDTVIHDNPSLTIRRIALGLKEQPLRIVLDRSLRIPLDSTLLDDEHKTLILHTTGNEEIRVALQSRVNVEVIKLQSARTHDGVDLNLLVSMLGDRGIQELLVEGGPETARRFMKAGLLDRVIMIRTSDTFAKPVPLSINHADLIAAGVQLYEETTWGDDTIEMWSRPSIKWPSVHWP